MYERMDEQSRLGSFVSSEKILQVVMKGHFCESELKQLLFDGVVACTTINLPTMQFLVRNHFMRKVSVHAFITKPGTQEAQKAYFTPCLAQNFVSAS